MKVGIVCDNYKLTKYKNELTKKGFEFITAPFTHNTTTIQVNTTEDKVGEIKKLCEKLEFEFKNSN